MSEEGVERKLTAILAADVVGYSRLMGEDEAGTLARLKSLRKELVQPKIAGGRGRIVKLMGDGLLAEFPSVVEAVKCAVEIQQSMIGREADLPDERRLRLRTPRTPHVGRERAVYSPLHMLDRADNETASGIPDDNNYIGFRRYGDGCCLAQVA